MEKSQETRIFEMHKGRYFTQKARKYGDNQDHPESEGEDEDEYKNQWACLKCTTRNFVDYEDYLSANCKLC